MAEDNAYVSFLNVEGLNEALKVFDGFEIKGKKLATKHVAEESIVVCFQLFLSVVTSSILGSKATITKAIKIS